MSTWSENQEWIERAENAQARIRELEADNAELHKELDGFALMQRIERAKALLLNAVAAPYPCVAIGSKKELTAAINRALEALEGK